MAQERGGQVTPEDAAAHWYDAGDLPVIHAVRDQGILHDFPGRTEADLYVWLAEYRAKLEAKLPGEHAAESSQFRIPESARR